MLVAESRMVMGKAHVFHVGSLRCFLKNPGLCGRVECICYLSMIFVTFLLFMFMDRKL